jgi:hypothetical protein
MTRAEELRQRARAKMVGLRRRRRDPRYLRTLGRLVEAGLLTTNQPVRLHSEPLRVPDVLWAGEAEPRFLELLPALLVKRPSMLVDPRDLPEDLRSVVRRLRRNLVPETFRGIPGADVYRWLPRVGHKDKFPARLKSFRLKPDDVQLLEHLSQTLGISETDVIRRGLRALV